MTSDRWIRFALPALLLGAVGIGLAPLFVRVSEVGLVATAFWRLFFALPLLFLYFHNSPLPEAPRRAPSSLRDHLLIAMSGVFFGIDLALWHGSIHFTSVANATILTNFAPIFVTIYAFVAGERFRPLFLVGLATALGGSTLLVGSSLEVDRHHVFGDALGFTSAIFYGAYLFAVSRLRRTFTAGAVMAWGGVGAATVLFVVAVAAGDVLLASTLVGWGLLLGLALVSQVGGQGLITYALAHLPAAFSSVALLMQPAVAAAAAWLVLDEPLGLVQGVGAAIVLLGIVLARQGSRKVPVPEPQLADLP
ncbi:MAG: DMT family transporter [Euryarchaeota archaeon]|nr:DMT family transporter [Euryarchaeota archaeon]